MATFYANMKFAFQPLPSSFHGNYYKVPYESASYELRLVPLSAAIGDDSHFSPVFAGALYEAKIDPYLTCKLGFVKV